MFNRLKKQRVAIKGVCEVLANDSSGSIVQRYLLWCFVTGERDLREKMVLIVFIFVVQINDSVTRITVLLSRNKSCVVSLGNCLATCND